MALPDQLASRPADLIAGRGERVPANVVLLLAVADLWHEWILNFCILMALAAVLAPLLLLLALKYGTIETMRDRLKEDPVYRELKPAQTGHFRPEWFADLRQRKDVAFAIPTIVRGAAIVRIAKRSGEFVNIDTVPTAPGDPLLLQNQASVPQEGEAVLSAAAAAQLDLRVGDSLRIQINRGAEERVGSQLHLISVLSPRADSEPRLFVPLQMALDIESYREGTAIPDRGWPGGVPAAPPRYDGVFVLVPQPLDASAVRALTVGTGFSEIEELPVSNFAERTGLHVNADFTGYDLRVISEPGTAGGLNAVRQRLRGREAILLPYARGLELSLGSLSGTKLPLVGLSLSEPDAERLGINAPPWLVPAVASDFAKLGFVILPTDLQQPEGPLEGYVTQMIGHPALPLIGKTVGPAGVAIVPAELAGIIRTGMLRPLQYDAVSKMLVLGRAEFGGFRLYARSIDDVEGLEHMMITQDVPVVSQSQSIARIRIFDQALTRMFWLVAVVGIVGGAAALIASLYAAVERKRRELGMLRLLGIPRRSVFLFPIYQSGCVAVLGSLIALLGYGLLAAIINQVFARDLDLGEKLCRLPPIYLAVAVLATVTFAIACALVAGIRATQIDPAEAIRHE
jgi:putative ABC transport system permease protein